MTSVRARHGVWFFDITTGQFRRSIERGQIRQAWSDIIMHGRHPRALFGGFSDELRIAPEIIPVCVDFRRLIRDVNLRTIMRRAGEEIPYGARVFRDLIFAARGKALFQRTINSDQLSELQCLILATHGVLTAEGTSRPYWSCEHFCSGRFR
jgi:hypothetical protein